MGGTAGLAEGSARTSEVGWARSLTGVIISAPASVVGAVVSTFPVVASSTTSVVIGADSVAGPAPPPVTVNDGPVAPGFRTSVAETASFGGFNCGAPV